MTALLLLSLLAQSPAPGDVALVVGIEKYAFVEPVPGAKQNALDWRDFLRGRGIRTYLLLDNEATEERILAEAGKVADDVQKDAKAWSIYVGHGAPLFESVDGAVEPSPGLVAFDAQNDALSLQKRSVPVSKVIEALNKGAQRDTIAVIDSCFSGKTAKGGLVPGLQPVIAIRAKKQARVVQMTAGRSDQFAGPLPGYGRPAFSYLVLGALKGWGDTNADGVVSSREAVDFADSVLSRVLTDRRQTPELIGEDVQLGASLGEKGPSIDDFLSRAKEVPTVTATTGTVEVGTGRRTAGWLILGVGAAVGVGAVIAGLTANGLAAQSRSVTTPQTQTRTLFQQAQSTALIADIGYGLAAAAGVTGLILILTAPSSSSVAVGPWAGSGQAGLVFSGAF